MKVSRKEGFFMSRINQEAVATFAEVFSTAGVSYLPFIALEPWTGLSTCSDEGDVFEEKGNIQKAAPGNRRTYSFGITIFQEPLREPCH